MPCNSSRLIAIILFLLMVLSCRSPVSVDRGFAIENIPPADRTEYPAVVSEYSVGSQEAPLTPQEAAQPSILVQTPPSPAVIAVPPAARVYTPREWNIPQNCGAETKAEFEIELSALINAERTGRGLAPLDVEPRLISAARRHTTDMACNHLFSHTGSDGTSPFDRIRAEGYTFAIAGENIYGGKEHHDEPAAAVSAWQRSSSHRAVMLHPDFCHIGVAYLFNPNSRFGGYVTAAFGCPD